MAAIGTGVVLILPQGNVELRTHVAPAKVHACAQLCACALVVLCRSGVLSFTRVHHQQFKIYLCLHPAAEEASDLVVAMATVLLVFKRRSSEDGRTRSRSVGRLYLSSPCLSFMSLSSQVPLCFLLFASPPSANVRKSADCSLLHLLFHLRIPAE